MKLFCLLSPINSSAEVPVCPTHHRTYKRNAHVNLFTFVNAYIYILYARAGYYTVILINYTLYTPVSMNLIKQRFYIQHRSRTRATSNKTSTLPRPIYTRLSNSSSSLNSSQRAKRLPLPVLLHYKTIKKLSQ